jgi:hypothetical protein
MEVILVPVESTSLQEVTEMIPRHFPRDALQEPAKTKEKEIVYMYVWISKYRFLDCEVGIAKRSPLMCRTPNFSRKTKKKTKKFLIAGSSK